MTDPREAAARYRARQQGKIPDEDADAVAPGATAAERAAYIETAIQIAIRRGDFDDLPGAGKPIPGLGTHHDPDWWIRRKIQSENLTGLGPPAIMLRGEDKGLDERLDLLSREADVREELEGFNRRVIEARRQLQGGPPVVTSPRDVDAEVEAWAARRAARAARAAAAVRESESADLGRRRRFGIRRRS